ncbi:MAG: chemotaxis protein CheD [Kiritimatiellae bacterium]|nr:chemotaxis protein CheD [Kiritimatiellia bacterium]
MAVSANPDDVLVTYSLGSCLGVTVHDPVRRIGGLIHCMLPLSKIDPAKAQERPCLFVDLGVPLLLKEMLNQGAHKEDFVIKVAGASSVLDNRGLFRIGERNYTVLRRILWKNGLLIAAEEVGGNVSRTLRLKIATGQVVLKAGGKEIEI